MKYNIPLNTRKRSTSSSSTNIATVPTVSVHYRLQLHSCRKIQYADLNMDADLDLDRKVRPIKISNHSKIEFERSTRPENVCKCIHAKL